MDDDLDFDTPCTRLNIHLMAALCFAVNLLAFFGGVL